MQRQRDRDCSRPKTQEQKIGRQKQTHVETDKRDIKSLKQSRKNYKKRQGTWRETEAEERRVKQAETERQGHKERGHGETRDRSTALPREPRERLKH